MSTLLNKIAEGVHEIVSHATPDNTYAVRNSFELKSDYRRLKQMHACDATQIFPNSRMLPAAKTFTHDEDLAKHYWSHLRSGVSFDCCPLHMSKKQHLLEIVRSETTHEESAQVNSDNSNVLKIQPIEATVQDEKRKEMMDKIFAIDETAPLRKIRGRELAAPDTESLRYQLHLTQQRLESMQTRSLKRAV